MNEHPRHHIKSNHVGNMLIYLLFFQLYQLREKISHYLRNLQVENLKRN